jgi:hypothetical protein
MRNCKGKLLLLAVFAALVVPMLFAGTAVAKYVGDNAVPDGAGGWALPEDKGFCVTGIKRDGTMVLDLTVGNNRNDCIANLFPAYTTSAACVASDKATGDVEGSHYWSSACVAPDGVTGISLSGLDRTRSMCEQKGGTYKSTCTSSWVAMGPTFSAGITLPSTDDAYATTGGTDGFCYASMRLDNYHDDGYGDSRIFLERHDQFLCVHVRHQRPAYVKSKLQGWWWYRVRSQHRRRSVGAYHGAMSGHRRLVRQSHHEGWRFH